MGQDPGYVGLADCAGSDSGLFKSGGALSTFRKGISVHDLLWRMRLRSFATLEFYLQEMSAISILPNLDRCVCSRIVAAASLYEASARR